MLVTAVLIGLALSVGVIIIVRMSIFPPRVSMEKVLSERMVVAEKGTDIYAASGQGLRDLYTATSRRLEGRLDLTSRSGLQLKKDLAMIGKSTRRHTEHKLVSAMACGLFGVIVGVGLLQSSLPIPFPIIVVIILVVMFALFGVIIPDSLVKTEATKARKEFDELVLSWLDLVMPLIASGRDVSAAFIEASALSRAWPFQMLGQHMSESRHLGKPIWSGLRKLIDEKGLERLEQLASALELSQRSGAELRQTVVAQVHSYRSENPQRGDSKIRVRTRAHGCSAGIGTVCFHCADSFSSYRYSLGLHQRVQLSLSASYQHYIAVLRIGQPSPNLLLPTE